MRTETSMSNLALDPAAVQATLEASVARLPADEARAYRMRELEGMDPRAICAALGIGEEVLFDLLFRARMALVRELFGTTALTRP
jgi:DNA-directed RNA polymerase specialized sigma24 family protein